MGLSQNLTARELARRAIARVSNPHSASAWWNGQARLNQLPPEGDWRIWLILAGRGYGKTRSIVEWAIEQARIHPNSRGALIGATASDTRDILVTGESGVLNVADDAFRPIYNPSKRLLTFPNGSVALLFSADKPDRLRGVQHHWAICDELAAWRYGQEAWDMLLMGLRLGSDPRVAIATTPRATRLIRNLVQDPTCIVRTGSTYENKDNLAPPFLDAIVRRYQGTRIGRQELDGAILDDNPGALWKRDYFERGRVLKAPDLVRIVVAIDPAASSDSENSAETGIVVVGVGRDGHGYVLDDATLQASPNGWASAAIAAYHKFKADRVIAERNNGGDMVSNTLRMVDGSVAVKTVWASRGKQTRAEPVAALYEQGRVHHVGTFPELEDQCCQWTPDDDDSPDRMDALVWALTALIVEPEQISINEAPSLLSDWRG